MTRKNPPPVCFRSSPLDVNLAQSNAECPGVKATFALFFLSATLDPPPPEGTNPSFPFPFPLDGIVVVSCPPFCIPKFGFFVVLGGGAIFPKGTLSATMAILRSDGGVEDREGDLGGEGGASENEGVGSGSEGALERW